MAVGRAHVPDAPVTTRRVGAWSGLVPGAAPDEAAAVRGVYLHVTAACNLRCSYCYLAASGPLPGELSGGDLAAVWPALVALRPGKVVLTGGEPLLRPDLLALLAGLRAADPGHRVLRCVNTNGLLVTAGLARDLVGLADEVRVSIDALAGRNDAQRGPGSFAAALAALECLHAAGFEPKALVTVTADSLPDLEDLLCLLAGRGITRVNVNPLRLIGRARRGAALQVSLAEVQAAVDRAWARLYPRRPSPPPARPQNPAPGARISCGAGQFLNIMPGGDVFPCHVLTRRALRCGNVREDDLAQICRPGGLLARLRTLDLSDLASQDDRVAELARPGACLGAVYSATRDLPVWRQYLPLAGGAAPAR